MIVRSFRKWMVAFCMAGATVLFALLPARAEEDVLRQTNEGQGIYWLPIISRFYVKPEQSQLIWPQDDGPPAFPEGALNPPFHFTLNPSPADSAPTIDTDWVVLQKRLEKDERASAWVVAREFGKPRIWIHRSYDEEYLAGYTESQKHFIVLELDVVRESFPIPGQLGKPERQQLIRDNVRVVSGTFQMSKLNGVRKTGSGGQSELIVKTGIAGGKIADFPKTTWPDVVPRGETTANGDLLDGIVAISIELELEAGTALGLDAPERKKLSGEIRFAVGEQYISIAKLAGGSHKK